MLDTLRVNTYAGPVKYSRGWLQILGGGLLLFGTSGWALRVTGNINYFPTVILLGSFVVPAAFVTFFYEHVRHRDISMPLLTSCFLAGGVLGIVAAGLLEYGALRSLDVTGLLGVAVIEEGGKLIFPVAMYLGWRYRHEADGLLFGIAAGMGFAALETMGYGLVSVLQSRGDLGALQQLLLVRGFLSPAGHAAWTGYVCAVLWRQREKRARLTIDFAVVGAFFAAVVLHALWDMSSSLAGPAGNRLIVTLAGNAVVAVVSLALLVRRYREAKRLLPTSPSLPE